MANTFVSHEHPSRIPSERAEWLRTLALSDPQQLADALDPIVTSLQLSEEIVELRAPQVGLALVTGRVGATGDAFGLGEMTVSRCVVQVGNETGIGYVSGRDHAHARRIAVTDALLRTEHRETIEREVLEPLRVVRLQTVEDHAIKAAATRVEFLTMVRGN